jgi:DNA-binding MarR family transcriptional regulator
MTPLQRLAQALEVFRSHDEIIPSQRIEVFLLAALRHKVTREDTGEALNMSRSAAFRHLMALSDEAYIINATRKQGIGLLHAGDDPAESRRKIWTLTAKGKRVAAQVGAIMEGA